MKVKILIGLLKNYHLKKYFFKTNAYAYILMRRVEVVFYIFTNLLMSGIIKDSWFPISASAFNLL